MFNRDDNSGGRNMPQANGYTGDWTCSKCQAKTPHSLPFTPKDDRPVYCRDCYKAMKEEERRR